MKISLVLLLAYHAVIFCNGGLCPPDWIRFRRSCYVLMEDKMNWETASGRCVEMGGGLAVPSSTDEHRFIWDMFTKSVTGENLWIGCSDQTGEGKYAQPGDESHECTYTDWAEGEPTGIRAGDQDCIQLWYAQAGHMDDTICSEHHFFICERPASPFSTSAMFCLPADASDRYTPRSLTGHVIKTLLTKGFAGVFEEPGCRSVDLPLDSQGDM